MKDIFLSILEMSLWASVTAVIVIIARLCLKKVPKVFSLALWAAVLFRLVIPFGVPIQVGWLPVSSESVTEDTELSKYSEDVVTIVGNVYEDENGAVIVDAPYYIPSEQREIYDLSEIDNIDDYSKSEGIDKEAAVKTCSVIWIIGTVVLFGYMLYSYMKLKRKMQTAFLVSGNIYESQNVKNAFVLGFIHPRIYISDILSAEEKRCIILHEKMHIKHWDHIIKLIAFMALCLHWFNPVIWLSYVLMCRDMEQACDEAVIRSLCGDADSTYEIKRSYAETIMAQSSKKEKLVPVAFARTGIKERITNIMKYRNPKLWTVVISCVVCVMIVFACACSPVPKNNSGTATVNSDEWEYEIGYSSNTEPYVYVTIMDYLGQDTEITVPSELDGYPVRYIGKYVFAESDIVSVKLPDTVFYLSEGVFYNCKKLKAIEFSDTLDTVGTSAFAGCTSLEYADIPDSVNDIYSKAFEGCTALREITIPQSCTYLHNNVFANCTALETVRLHSGVVSFGDYVFLNCTSLISINIPENIHHLSENAFEGCVSLDSSLVPHTSVFTLDDVKLSYNKVITMEVPEGTTEISDNYSGYIKLEKVILPDGLKIIGREAFNGCSLLASINLPESLTYIAPSVFGSCPITEITVPGGVKVIETTTFLGCRQLKQVTLCEGIEVVFDGAFRDCTALSNISLPNSLTYIGEEAFRECTSLKEITIPANVTYIADDAFRGCGESLTIICKENSYVHEWAEERSYNVSFF